MLTIAGGIVLGLMLVLLLPVLLPILWRLLGWAVILVIIGALLAGAYALWQEPAGPTLIVIAALAVIAAAIKIVVTGLGGITNAVQYARAWIKPARTADEVAAKARRLQQLRDRAKDILETERDQAKREARSAFETELLQVMAKFAPGAEVSFEERTYDFMVLVGSKAIAKASISPPEHFFITPADDDRRERQVIIQTPRAAAEQVKKLLKARLVKTPDLLTS